MAGEALDVFTSYSHRDEGLKDELVNYHLKLLQREGKINTWQDRNIEAGSEWAEEIRTLATNSLLSERPNREPLTVELPNISGSSPDDLSAVEVQTVKVDNTGTITERPQGQVNAFREDLGNGIGLDMVEIPAGEFVMGSPPEEEGRDDDEGPQRTVSVPRFFMGRFQVTQAQYEAVMGKIHRDFKAQIDQ